MVTYAWASEWIWGLTDRTCSFRGSSPSAMHIGKSMEVKDPENTQEPQNRRNNDDSIQDGLDIRLHGDEAVHQPQQKPYDHERNNHVD